MLVEVVNNKTNEILLKSNGTGLWDHTALQLKEKLFAFVSGPGQIWYPKLLRLSTKKGDTIKYFENLSKYYDEGNPIYVHHFFDEIQRTELAQNIADFSDNNILEIHSRFQNDWSLLTVEDIEFTLKFLTFKTSPQMFSYLRQDVEGYLNKVLDMKQRIQKQYIEEEIQMKDYYDYIKVKSSKEPLLINVENLTLSVQPSQPTTARIVDMSKLFDSFELNENIPFAALSGVYLGRKEPVIKVYNKVLDGETTSKDVKSWIINERTKSSKSTLKKVKGLVIKVRLTFDDQISFMTVNMNEMGHFIISSSVPNNIQISIEEFKDKMERALADVIETINERYPNVIRRGSTLQLDDKTIELQSVSAQTEVHKIPRAKIAGFLRNRYYSENLFDPKDTIGKDILSMFYKRFMRSADEEDSTERKGITVTVQDHPEKATSSIIYVSSAQSYNQIPIIAMHLVNINNMLQSDALVVAMGEGDQQEELLFPEEEEEHKLKGKSKIKQLKEKGVKVISTNCQRQRQPILSDTQEPHENAYDIVFEEKRYICPNPDYPFPGFTNENVVCCFKKDQRSKEPYMRNMASNELDEMIESSNFQIEVDHNGQSYKAFVIKSMSDKRKHKYHFLDINNVLVPVTSEALIIELDKKDDIWLEPTPLNRILTQPPKNKCMYAPDFTKRVADDPHSQCSVHSNKVFFGYNLNGYPCCFDKPRKETVTRKRRAVEILKQHIITTEKILESNRVGVLPNGISQIFNGGIINQRGPDVFLRMGVVQNVSSLLNVILLALDNTINNAQVTGSLDFRSLLATYVENQGIFTSLNGGDIALSFSLPQFVFYLRENILNPTMILDLLMRVTQHNILIIDYTDVADIRFLCSKYVSLNTDKPYIIVLKRESSYELVVKPNQTNVDLGSMTKTFTYSDSVVKVLHTMFTEACTYVYDYPDAFGFDKPWNANFIIQLLRKSEHKITFQIVNEFNKTHLLVTESSFIIPIMETGILPSIQALADFKANMHTQLKGIDLLQRVIEKASRKYKKEIPSISVLGQIVDGRDSVVAMMTNFGIPIPVERHPVIDLPVYDYNYYPNVDSFIFEEQDYTAYDESKAYIQRLQLLEVILFWFKGKLAITINANTALKEEITQIIRAPGNFQSKFTVLQKKVEDSLSSSVRISETLDILSSNYSSVTGADILSMSNSAFAFFVDIVTQNLLTFANENEIMSNFVLEPVFLQTLKSTDNNTIITSQNELQLFLSKVVDEFQNA